MNSAVTGKLKAWRNEPGKRPPEGAGKQVMQAKSVRNNTKSEPVVGRNIHQRARPCKGAKLTPWLWTGGTKEVSRSSYDMGGYVLVFKDMESYVKAFPKIMQFYNLKELEYEYSDNLTEGRKTDKQWWEELYLLSSDDALVLIHPKGGN